MRLLPSILLPPSACGIALAAPSKATSTTGPYIPLQKPKVAPWTIKSFTRDCDSDRTGDSACAISFWVDTNTPGEPPSYCYFIIASFNAITNKIPCSRYWQVGSSWSQGSGIPGQGFTKLSLYHELHGLIAWEIFYDSEVVNGVHSTRDRIVVPDWY